MNNMENLNRFKYEFLEKATGKISYYNNWCYGNIYEQIDMYKKDLKKMCLVGISNDTHKIIRVTHLFNNKVIYEEKQL